MILPGARHRTLDTSKDTQFSDAWVVLAVILIALGLILDNRFLTLAALAIVVIAGASWLWARFSLQEVSYIRRFSEQRAFQGEKVELQLMLSNRKFLPQTWVTIRDLFPPELPISDTKLSINPTTNLADYTTFWMVGPFQTITRRYHVDCTTRGFHFFGPATVTSGDPFGFFNQTAVLSDTSRLIVYPRLYAAADLDLPTKDPFGEIRVRNTLFEDPLRTAGIRAWRSSDGIRRVHWKATARRQELQSKIYEPSEEHVLQIFLNVATMERHWHGYIPELHERTISVAGSLAALAIDERIPVGLVANGALPGSDQPIKVLPGRSPSQLVHIMELLAAVTSFATGAIEDMLIREAAQVPWGATLMVVTAIASPALLSVISDLAGAGRKVVLFTLAEKPPADFLEDILVYHLPHLVDDLIAPDRIGLDLHGPSLVLPQPTPP